MARLRFGRAPANPAMTDQPDPAVTLLLQQMREGDAGAGDRLVPLVYEDLRLIASRLHRGDPQNCTLNPTALVHEAFVRLAGRAHNSRAHFLGAAATAMRNLLVDYVRARKAEKRAGGLRRVTLSSEIEATAEPGLDVDLLDLEEALQKLGRLHARQARVVELRFLAGMEVAEAAEVLGVSERTVKGDWQMARAWLSREFRVLGDERGDVREPE